MGTAINALHNANSSPRAAASETSDITHKLFGLGFIPTGSNSQSLCFSSNHFVVGYGAVRAVHGPLFTFAAYLGWTMAEAPNHRAGALLAAVGLFPPGPGPRARSTPSLASAARAPVDGCTVRRSKCCSHLTASECTNLSRLAKCGSSKARLRDSSHRFFFR